MRGCFVCDVEYGVIALRVEGGDLELSEREEVITGLIVGAAGAGRLGLFSVSDPEECAPESIWSSGVELGVEEDVELLWDALF